MFFQRPLWFALQCCSLQCYSLVSIADSCSKFQSNLTYCARCCWSLSESQRVCLGRLAVLCPGLDTGPSLAGWVRRVSTLLSWALLQPSPAKGTRGSPGSHQATRLSPDMSHWLALCHRAGKLPEEYPAAPKPTSSSTWMPLLQQ